MKKLIRRLMRWYLRCKYGKLKKTDGFDAICVQCKYSIWSHKSLPCKVCLEKEIIDPYEYFSE